MPLYHGSKQGGIKTLLPRASTHGEAYVYASDKAITALLFLGQWHDFILNLAYGDDGVPEVTERFPGAFEQVFSGVSGYLYTLPEASFESGLTRFEGERVSKGAVDVLDERHIEDVYAYLIQASQQGRLRILRPPQRHPDIPADDSDLVEDALYFYEKGDKNAISECLKYHPGLAGRFGNLATKP